MLNYNGFFLLDRLNRAALKADGPYTEAEAALTGIETEAADKRHIARVLLALLMPSTSGAVGKRAQSQAQAAVTQAGAAVLAQAARTGHPPDSLPSGFTDPFTGKLLGYRREAAQGFVVYSAGKDGHFDGGKPGEYHWNPYQVAFRYPGAISH
jgi:hypothetical protein